MVQQIKMRTILHFLVVLKVIFVYAVDALIGLRPPSGVPHYLRSQYKSQDIGRIKFSEQIYKHLHHVQKKDRKIKDPLADPFLSDSLNKYILQRTYRNHTVNNNILQKATYIKDTSPISTQDLQTGNKRQYVKCQPIAINRCGIQFLKGYLRNSTDECQLIQALEKCLLDRLGDFDVRNVHFLLKDVRKAKSSTSSCPTIKHNFQGYREMTDQLALCEVNILECVHLTYKELLEDTRSCDPISKFTSCIASAIGYKSDNTATKIFSSIMSLTKTCVHSRVITR